MNPRPDPEALLFRISQSDAHDKKGRLKIFFGAAAGVGKTYSMLEAAHKIKAQGRDVLVGFVETHGRKETESLLLGHEVLPPQQVEYKGTSIKEFDIDAALRRKPELILVDELAHTNAFGCRHAKRWQDVQELLENGIDVYTTLNVQHVESLHDVVAQVTRVSVRERVPDVFLEKAQEIELVDLPPDELLQRMREGKVYIPEKAKSALENFFRKGNLIALRELGLRYLATRVESDMDAYRQSHAIKHPWPASERILVCISPSPLAFRLVRAGKRMADALRARWTVLYVEGLSNGPISRSDRDSVVQTLRLAEQLGAETIELSGVNIAEEIIRSALQYNVSKIIIGKSCRSKLREIIYGNIVDSVIRQSGAIDVYVITGDDLAPVPTKEPIFRNGSAPAYDSYPQAFAVIIFFTLIAKWMTNHFELSNVVMFYLLGVIFVAMRFGRGPSIMASIFSVAAFDFFCVPPYFTFAVSDTQYLITFMVMLIVALITSTLMVTIKAQAESARLREIRTAALYSMSRDLSSALDTNNLLSIGLKHLSDVFNCQCAVFLIAANGELKLACQAEGEHCLSDFSEGIASWVVQNRQSAGLGTATLPGGSELYLPLLSGQNCMGVLVVKPVHKDRLGTSEQFRLLETFANQISLACGRSILADESERARLQVKTEQMRNSLLSSVSHDLRTPLATIAGAASSILEEKEVFDKVQCLELVSEIYSESMRLNRLVSNLLEMTKLESKTLILKREYLPADEVVGAALTYMEDRLGDHPIETDIQPGLPLLVVDSILIHQVLINLLENAVKYSDDGSTIKVGAYEHDDVVVLFVADHGSGIQLQDREKVFEKFYRADNARSKGAGLGLAICFGIVEAHEGKIWVEDTAGGGATFKFTVKTMQESSFLPSSEENELE